MDRVVYPEILAQSSAVIFRLRGVVILIIADDETKQWQTARQLTLQDPH